jgi:hypothetical protein
MVGSADLVAFVTNLSLGVPLLILGGASLAWWITTRVARPPSLGPTPNRRSWKESPGSVAYAALAEDRYLLSVYLLRERLTALRGEQRDVRAVAIPSGWEARSIPDGPLVLALRRAQASLNKAYLAAYLDEEAPRAWAFSEWSTERRSRGAQRAFDQATDDMTRALETLGPGSW